MIQKLAIVCGLIVSTTCMVLHQAPLPLYLPLQYHDQTPNYNFPYEFNDARTGDFKNQQENSRGDGILGQYSLLQPDGITRTVDYSADDHPGFNALANSDRRPSNVPTDRKAENNNDGAARQNNAGAQVNQPWPTPNPNIQHGTPTPVTITHTSVYHHTYSNGHNPWI